MMNCFMMKALLYLIFCHSLSHRSRDTGVPYLNVMFIMTKSLVYTYLLAWNNLLQEDLAFHICFKDIQDIPMHG